MRKILWILFLLPSLADAQPYHPVFLKDSTVWKYYFLIPFGWNEGTGSLRDSGTSIKNGKMYRIIPNNPYSPYLVREDTISRKIYSFDSYTNAEYLLYDFSLSKGNTFNLYGFNPANCFERKFYSLVVDTIYYVSTPLGSRKQIELGGRNIVWREGVGIIQDKIELTVPHFIYNAFCPYFIDDGNRKLICVKQDNQLAYENPYITSDSTKYYCDTTIYDTCHYQSVITTQRYAECTGDSIEYFCNSLSKHAGISYQWYFNGSPVGGNKDKIKLMSKNDDSVRCVVSNSFNCPVKLKSSGLYVLYNYPINNKVVKKDSTLVALADNVSYYWYDCDSNQYLSSEQNKSFKPKKDGRYSVIISQRDCKDTSDCISVFLCNPQLYIDGKDTMCKNAMAAYTAKVSNAGIQYKIQWYVNNSLLSTNTQINIVPDLNDSLYFKLTPDSQCIPTSVKYSHIKKIYHTYIDKNLYSFSNAIYTKEKGTYQWLYCDSNFKPIPNQTRDTFFPIKSGFYAVEISKNGCKDTSGCYIFVKSSIAEKSIPSVHIYPSPARDFLKIEYPNNLRFVGAIQFYDLLGREIDLPLHHSEKNVCIFDVSNIPNGLYFLKLQNECVKVQIER